ncbi:MAG: hypothetical protein R6V55_12000 [Desulfovermiculus sp.]
MQMTIRLPDEYKAHIEDIALRTGLKKSEIARLAIKRFIESFDAQEAQDRPASRAKDLLGVAESGISDLGAEHRRHLLRQMRDRS